LAAAENPASDIAEELYLSTFSRRPTMSERQYAMKLIDSAADRRLAVEDLMWAMINSPEFSIQD